MLSGIDRKTLRCMQIGAASVIALVLMLAMAGQASAATVFCKTNVTTCSKENTYPLKTEVVGGLTEGIVTTFTMPIGWMQSCPESTIKVISEEQTAEQLIGRITALNFSGCESDEGPCVGAQARNLPWRVEFTSEVSPGVDKIVAVNGGKGNPGFQITCFGAPCNYELPSVDMNMPGGEQSRLEATGIFVNTTLGCESKVQWSANYNSLSPKPIFLTN